MYGYTRDGGYLECVQLMATIYVPADYSTIAAAITAASPGDTVDVAAGVYTGGVTVNKAITLLGHTGTRIVAAVEGVGNGITIAHDDVVIDGLSVERFEIAILPSGFSDYDNVTVQNCYTYYSQFHIWIAGTNWIVQNNEFDRVRWWTGTGDADYGRMFGTGHLYKRNYCHGTNFENDDLAPASGTDYAHTDCLQYYGNNGDVLQSCIIEENFFTDFHQGLFLADEFAGSLDSLIIRNNVFWGQSYTPPAGSSNFTGLPSWGILIGKDVGGTNMTVQNNLLYNIAQFFGMRAASDGDWTKNIVLGVGGTGTVYDPDCDDPSACTIDNVIYGYSWVGTTGFTGSDTVLDPALTDTAAPLGDDGVFPSADDGWIPTAGGALLYGPQFTFGISGATGLPMVLRISPIPVQSSALNTYTRDVSTSLYTYKYAAPLVSGTKDLTVRVYTGSGWDASIPRPCVAYMSCLAFSLTNNDETSLTQDLADFFVKAGIVFMHAKCRVQDDNPSNPDDAALGITSDLEARTVNAVMDDCKHLYQWICGVRGLDNWSVEPNWVFPASASAGAISWMLMARKYSWMRAHIPGMILSAAAYGGTSLPLYDTAIRTTLGYTEAGHDSSMPPIRAQLGGADTSLGVGRVADMKSLLDGLGAPTIVDYDADGGHETLLTFDTTALVAATTIAEAMKEFIDARTSVIDRSVSGCTFG